MKYWGYFMAKLAAAVLLMWAARAAIRLCFPRPPIFLGQRLDPFMHDLGYTTAMMLFSFFCAGLIYLIVWDQRYRCRTCLRWLRMPIIRGSWPNMLLFGQPRTEYICIYGHGTLKVPEVQITGASSSDWEPHDEDIWKELEALEAGRK
jgi:hypothetical protein